MTLRLIRVLVVILVMLGLSRQTAWAQIQEIVVTAEKRTSTAQETPISISAFDQRMLDELGIQSVFGIGNQVPSLFFNNDNNDWKVTIRGVGGDNLSINAEPGVAFHQDGVYLARPSGFNAVLFDTERIEVLRGPQGTLYGRNATGGAINVHSRLPSYEFEALGDALYGDYDRVRLRGAVNAPIVDNKLAFRGSIVGEKRDGYQTNVNPDGTEGDDADELFLRGQLLWDVNEDFQLIGRVSHLQQEGVGPVRVRLAAPPDSTTPDGGFIPDFEDLRLIYKDHDEARDLDQTIYSVEGNLQLPFTEATLVAGYSELDLFLTQDGDLTIAVVGETRCVAPPPGLQCAGSTAHSVRTQEADQFTTELRFASLSDSDSRLEWIIGGFYLNEDAEGQLDVRRVNTGPVFGPFTGTTSSEIDNDNEVETTSYAAFGELSYTFLNDVTITGGLRYTYDEREGFSSNRSDLFNPGQLPGNPPGHTITLTAVPVKDDWSKLTWKAAIDWTVAEHNLLYFTASTGFRSGGFNFGTDDPSKLFYEPEDLLAFELGSKNRFFDEHLQLNFAGFYYDYDDLQVFQLIDNSAFVQNAAEAEIYGLEMELVAEAFEGFQIDGHFSWIHGKYKDFESEDQVYPDGPDGVPDSGDEVFQVSGNDLINTPEYSGLLGIQYTFPVASWGDLTMRAQVYAQSEIYLRQFNLDPWDRQDSFTKTDITARFNSRNEHWYLFAGIENIEDEDVISNIDVNPTGIFFTNVRPPRIWWFGAGMSF